MVDIPDESTRGPENDMVFRLNPEFKEKKDKDDDPMWGSASLTRMDWFFEEE